MQVPRLLVALAVAGALLSPALAHRPPAPYFPAARPFVETAKTTIEGMTLDEIIQWSDAQFARRVAWGKYVRYGGTLILGASLVLTALDWFYDEAKRATGTSLDDWYWWTLDGLRCYGSGGYIVCTWDHDNNPNTGAINATVATLIYTSSGTVARWKDCAGGGESRGADADAYIAEAYHRAPPCFGDAASQPPLSSWLESHPDAADGVKQAVTDYLDEQDAQGNIPQTFSEPLPGLELDPPPTGNQWYDDPFFNPYEDTDGDGWPDWFEWDVGSDPSNAGSQPLPGGDPDGDGYDNASERDAGTDPTDPSSRPDVEQDQDADGDGLKDSADPCPNDPNNMCEPEEEESPEELPDPTEPTLTPVELPQLDQPQLPDASGRFDQVRTNFEENLQTLWDTLQDRFPVGMARWIPAPPSVSGGTCQMSFTLQIPDLPTSAQVDLCDSPPMQWAATTGRRIILASLMVGFLFAVARRASNA